MRLRSATWEKPIPASDGCSRCPQRTQVLSKAHYASRCPRMQDGVRPRAKYVLRTVARQGALFLRMASSIRIRWRSIFSESIRHPPAPLVLLAVIVDQSGSRGRSGGAETHQGKTEEQEKNPSQRHT